MSGSRRRALQYPPESGEHSGSPFAVRQASSLATAERQEWSSLKTWPRKRAKVTNGVKIRSQVLPTS